jgi:hypothetical protein
MPRISRFALLALTLLAGCSTDSRVADELTTFNEAQQHGTAQLILLNILRARDRQPLAYSHFEVMRGGLSGSSSVGLGLPFGPGAGSVSTSSLAAALGASPGLSQDVKPQDDQDFYRGILTPVSAETWALYQDQNWAPDLLFHMFVEYIKLSRSDFDAIFESTGELCRAHADIADVSAGCADLARKSAGIAALPNCAPDAYLAGGKPVLKLLNDPGDRCRQLQYDALTAAMTILGFHIAQVTTKTDLGPPMPASAFREPRWPFSIKDSNVEVARSGADYRFRSVSKTFAVSLSNLPCADAANIAVAATSEIGAQIEASKDGVESATRSCQNARSFEIGITTRSPDGMLYYMGEVARAALPADPGREPQIVTLRGDHGEPEALMVLERGEADDAAVRVTYRGETFSVPHRGEHITMQAFELLAQVFALYNRASTTPSTAAVTVVP